MSIFQANDTLQKVDLSWNGFAVEGAEAINRLLGQNSTITDLDLTNNRFGDKSILKLLNGLKVNSGLQVLKVKTFFKEFYQTFCSKKHDKVRRLDF